MVSPVQQTPKVSAGYISWSMAANRGIMGHFYTLISATGVQNNFTDLDIDINYNGAVWVSNSLRFEGLQRKLGIGTSVDEQNLRIWASPNDTLFGSNFLSGAEQGLLDGATIVRARAVWTFVTGNAALDITQPPLAWWTLFTGYMGGISAGGASHIDFKVRSALHKLDVNMPRNYYQPGCLWTLFDSNCTLSKAAYGISGTVGSGANSNTIPVSGGIATAIGADGIAQYAQGRLLFTSGVNSGLQVVIQSNDASNLYLTYLLNNVPSAGDSITYYPGCSKAFNTCQNKYANQANYRGFDKVPPVMVSV